MHSKRTILVTLVLLAGSLAGDALAAETKQALLNKGNKLFAAGDYAAAYEVFKQGNETSPSPVFLRSMGFSALKSFKHKEARDAFKAYLEKYPKEKDRKNIEDVLRNLEVVVKTQIKITSDPPGATLYFDLESVGKVGTTPYEGTIEPGKHTAILKLAGFHMTTKTFSIAPEKTVNLSIGMEVPFKVTSRTPGASVRLGSATAAALGTTPYEGGIPMGKHKVFVTAPGYRSFEKDVVAAKEGVLLSDVELKLGLRVASKPPGATVEVDGRTVEGATPVEVEATAGKHTISLKLAGYKTFSQEVTVTPGQDSSVDATMSGGLLSMRTNIAGAKVTVGKLEVGESPVERAGVPLGNQTVTVEHPSRRPWSAAVDFEENQMVQAEVKLAAPLWPVWVAAAATVVGAVVWTVGGVKAMQEKNADDDIVSTGQEGCVKKGGDDSTCNYSWHHMGTAGAVVTGVAAGTGLLYYLIWGRPSSEIKKVPVTAAKRPTRTAIH